jgi:hypothetical protein
VRVNRRRRKFVGKREQNLTSAALNGTVNIASRWPVPDSQFTGGNMDGLEKDRSPKKPERQRQSVVILSDRSREIIQLFEELHRKRQQVDQQRQHQPVSRRAGDSA